MESGFQDDQGNNEVTRQQNANGKDYEEIHAGEEKVKIVIINFHSGVHVTQ